MGSTGSAGITRRVARQGERMKKFVMTALLLALAAGSQPQTVAEDTKPKGADQVLPASTAAIPAGAYTLDRAHASLIFRVNHLGFSNYTARFKRFDAQLEFDPANLATSKLVATVDANSLETDFPDPALLDFNAVLKGDEWLDVVRFPEIRFESKEIDVIAEGRMRVNGELTLHGVTRPIALEARFNGGYAGHPMDPNARIGFSAHGTLERSEFGIAYGVPAPGTTMGVSDEVNVVIEAEFTGPPLSTAGAHARNLPQINGLE
jgi:polyisoprenoid-binding protein YceI